MGKIYFESDVCQYFGLPSIPKKTWDGKSSFKDGVAVVDIGHGEEAYAAATFDADKDSSPRVKKVFSMDTFFGIKEIFVVPSYMDEDVSGFDMSEEDKQKAYALLEEAKELEMEGVGEEKPELPENEYFFENISSDEEAVAFIKSYNKANRIRGRVPSDHEAIVMKLSVMYADLQRQNKNSKKR